MATKKKLLQAAAGNAGGAGLDVEEVFSTNLYTGTNAALTVNTGLDQNTEGGMLWVKSRSTSSTNHGIWDTERTNGYYLPVNSTDNGGNIAAASGTTPFLRDGSFRWNSGHGWFNQSGDYVAWAFRKASNFFDVVTYTGNSTAGRTVSHNLGTDVGFMIIKNTTSSGDWICWHRSASTYAGRILKLNATDAVANNSAMLNNTNPTSTEFTVGTNYDTNGSGQSYVAYLFAHNDGDGEFGPDGDADIIKCGSYTGTGHPASIAAQQTIELGFEPQWFLTKRTNSGASWQLVDNMRGMASEMQRIYPDQSAAEDYEGDGMIPTPTGIRFTGGQPQHNASGGNYIYIAIRRGTKVPESATEVFNIDTYGGTSPNPPAWTSGFPVDMALWKAVNSASYSTWNAARLISGKYLQTAATNAELSMSSHVFDYQNGWNSDTGSNSNSYSWMWKRAPNYMDVVAYTGNYTAGHNISHNLGVAPEMMWVKKRDAASFWRCYHKDLGNTKALALNDSGVAGTSTYWSNTTPTESVFTVGIDGGTNSSGNTFIAYLFATLAGISKVGSVTHSGTTNVDCGFSSGARFVLLKRTDASGDWYVWDSERGIVSGNDPYLLLNSTAAEVTNTDYIDPLSSGFTITSSFTAGDYIFYAVS